MDTIKARGIVIRENDYSETDKYLTLLVKGMGKISVHARGAKKTKSKYLAASTIFCYGDYILLKLNGKYTLQSAEIITTFYKLRDDLLALSYASYYSELLDKNLPPSSPEDEIMLLFLTALEKLAFKRIPYFITDMVFETKLLQYTGYLPDFGCCSLCGDLNTEYITENGLLCKGCAPQNAAKIPSPVAAAMRFISQSGLNQAFGFYLDEKYKKSVQEILHRLITCSFDRNYKSYDFLSTIF